jgi:ABC-2 type transport system ATP-binding protein
MKLQPTKNIIEIKNLVKRFGNFTAVEKINLDVREGEIVGFLGPNGAGKTTTISMLTTLINPTSGDAKIAGYDLITDAEFVRRVIGVVPQSFSLFPELTAKENLEYIGRLYGLSSEVIEARATDLLKKVSLYSAKDRISGFFSGGMKQRLSIAASIMSSPKILFMDEPTTGLDPQSRIAVRTITKDLNKQGMTVIYTTHDMEEAEKVCDRILIMDKGKIIGSGTSEQLKHRFMKGHVLMVKSPDISDKLLNKLRNLRDVSKVKLTNGIIYLTVSKKEGVFYEVSKFLHKNKIFVEEINYKEPTLEEVFIDLTKKDLRD